MNNYPVINKIKYVCLTEIFIWELYSEITKWHNFVETFKKMSHQTTSIVFLEEVQLFSIISIKMEFLREKE